MCPDRIIIGEVRDGAAVDLLKAWNTGHPGGLTTLHANSAEATLSRLRDLIGEVVPTVPPGLIQHSVDMIVDVARGAGGRGIVRRIVALDEPEGRLIDLV